MKNKFISWLSLMAVFIFLLQSCRNDQFPEQETHNNGSAFRLTSKTISLSESKHFAKLSTELQKAEQTFKTFKANVSGKVVDYGNGVSIDTEQVIYIENGSNYHTYTFKINRENAPADAPVENLLLTPLPDGTYREFLVTYNFTEQEKQIILSGGDVSRKGKVEVTELEKGTFGNPMGKQTCGYQDVDVYFACYTGDHHAGNESTWGSCNWESAEGGGGYPAKHYTMVAMVCTGDPDPIDDSFYPIGGGGSSGGGGIFPNPDPQPEEPPCVVVPSTSLDPTLTDENGCAIGTPTLPNLGGNPKYTPCNKIKTIISKPQIKSSLITLKEHSGTSSKDEGGFQELKSGTFLPGSVIVNNQIEFGIGPNSLGTVHTHQLPTIAMFAPKDIMTFLHIVREQDASTLGNAYSGMVSSTGTYFINFTGTASDLPLAMTDAQEEAYVKNLVKEYKKHHIQILESEYKGFGQKASNLGLEKLFFNMLEKMGLKDKIQLIKVNEENGSTTTSTIEQNSNGIPETKSC
ncbi:hypothetical protein ATE47_16155 [Chryseobacterium sp. IHB B 17019]|uniref:hypothetical protein n=1 Tax=Chryseobacterium sp. IHB B 17019 TaxID=1721091 RepID=UPI000722AEC2|nr:hypothetical protein [Chryseobacterium sp. IHB B 17019]ALR31954.1 hypothetical protein ATE47_16155 [Chryseobacterium sp. IHB B 17019]